MNPVRKLFAAAALLAVWAHPAAAQTETQQSQSLAEAQQSDEIPPEIPTSAFAGRNEFSSARLSPDGNRFAFTVVRDETLYLSIFDSNTRQLVGGLSLGDPDDFKWFRWVNNDRMLFSVLGTDLRYGVRYSRLISYDIGPEQFRPLAIGRMSFDGDNIIHTADDGSFVLVSMSEGYGQEPDVWRFDLNSTEREDEIRGELEERRNPVVGGWITDETGVVRIGLGFRRRGQIGMRYRSGPDDDWDTVARARIDDDDAMDSWDFMGLRAGSDTGYSIAVPPGGDRRALMEFDFSTGELGDVVFQSPDEDVSSVRFDSQRNPIAVAYAGEGFRREWLDPEIRRWRDMLGAALPGSAVTILDVADDRSRMLVLQSGSADPGALYVFTPAERDLSLFAEYRPEVPAQALTAPQDLRYEARDGTTIHGYLTLPRGRGASNLPLIVHPHGGPYGIRDWDTYDDLVQLLANRGYAVVQPNFRGSGGYGESFELLGHGQIGRRMQDDLDDAVAHLVEEGIVDPDRVCIMGISYGGFAAAWGAIRNPEIYRCAISFAGVMHFERQLAHDSDYLFGRTRGRHWDRVDGDQTNFDLDDVSPAVQVARLTRPFLLVHGERDTRVPFDQYELMVTRARRADVEIETLVLEDSGHGFWNKEDEQAYYDALLDFLARHNPAD
ncbi:alpha/beta hydrolase family protein [Aurantiacibacter sp. D1-12]|uniref:alpha/beta hydrolase family protein n=1 Tax=Aurantiacibacter sp. D1-12 TaxID=2993658 RepID=UPI00237D23E1|nr:alpha/beta fold hydrolase [Aurantiacibacter sp. D1-12]MDE1467959.1 prolyl oligopeptidase family serine peptidase [Aurantiacibacter sp. D1-12]